MKDNKLTDWGDFWKMFDELIAQLQFENKATIIYEFKEAQKYVNGLTDGWYEFKFEFEKSLRSNRPFLNAEQNEIAAFLMTTLNRFLTNR